MGVALHLPEGNSYQLGGAQLRVHNMNATLRSEGDGATLDAQGLSRHFDVALGGRLHLERVHTDPQHGGVAMAAHRAACPEIRIGPFELFGIVNREPVNQNRPVHGFTVHDWIIFI